jgi:flagellar assembly factor FliW
VRFGNPPLEFTRAVEIVASRFGRVQYDSQSVIRFPLGLPAFEDCLEWLLLADRHTDSMAWLQSVARPEVAFGVVSPRRVVPGYQLRVARPELAPLEFDDVRKAEVLVVLSKTDRGLSVNLKAPLVINLDRRMGQQVMANGDVPLRYELDTARPAYRRSA